MNYIVLVNIILVFTFGYVVSADGHTASRSRELMKKLLRNLRHRRLNDRQFGGGYITDRKKFPYTVGILNHDKLLNGGVIIADEYVLTSYDNIADKDPWDLTVLADDTRMNVTEIYTKDHSVPGYLAILKVESKFNFAENINKITELQRSVCPRATNCTVEILGYNIKEIHYANSFIIENTFCDSAWDITLDQGHLCGGSYEYLTELCFPNAGDPLICNGVLTGIASSRNLCDESIFPGIYGNVSYHMDWIEEVIGGSESIAHGSYTTTIFTSVITIYCFLFH